MQRQHPVVHPLRAGAAILDHQIRMLRVHLADPFIDPAIVLQHRIAAAVAVHVAAHARHHVIVDLEVFAAVVLHQPIHHIEAVFPHLGVPEIQQITTVFDAALAVVAHKPAIRQTVRQLARRAHDLDLQPHAHAHSLGAAVVKDRFQSVGKAFRAFLPFAHPVPPRACVVPAAVQAVIFAAQRRGQINDLLFLLLRGVAEQAVHVIIEHHEALIIVLVGATNDPAIPRQRREGRVLIAQRHAKGCGHRSEAFS